MQLNYAWEPFWGLLKEIQGMISCSPKLVLENKVRHMGIFWRENEDRIESKTWAIAWPGDAPVSWESSTGLKPSTFNPQEVGFPFAFQVLLTHWFEFYF